MLRIGITGGIGSGKSIICEVFSKLGISIYSADNAAKEITANDPIARKHLSQSFGPGLFQNSILRKEKLRKIIFNDKKALLLVNSIIHPLVKIHFENWCNSRKDEPYILKEAAILIESGAYKDMDGIILVTASKETRRHRIQNRDHQEIDIINKIMNSQLSDSEKRKFAAFEIDNDGHHLILPQILNIHHALIKKTTE